jgi:RecB family exonuclease
VLAFLAAHERLPGPDDPARTRQLRARAAVLGTLESLRAAAARYDPRPVSFDEVVALVRRWLEGQTFALRTGEGGVHVVDADSARFGDFDVVHLAGLVDAEWPPRPRHGIFYSSALLKDLGWPAETALLQGARDAFLDLMRLPAREVLLSRFTLEDDALVAPSPFLEDAPRAGLEAVEVDDDAMRVFDYEALTIAPVRLEVLEGDARAWAEWRLGAPPVDAPRFRGFTGPPIERAFPVSMLERYLDCPFQYFARRELRLDEPPDDEPGLSPRDRGTFLHTVFQAFFEAWDASGQGPIAPATIDQARELFRQVAEPRLDALPPADAALERARLFGSAIRAGIVDVVLGLETARPGQVRERWLEHEFDGEFTLGDRRVALRGVADRVDLLEGRRLRVIDYKSGAAPRTGRALQVPIYALCAAEELTARDGAPWEVEEAAYLAFGARRPFTLVVKAGKAGAAALEKARDRAIEVVDGIARGEFPPRPHDPIICTWCAYPTVCRKDYVGDE